MDFWLVIIIAVILSILIALKIAKTVLKTIIMAISFILILTLVGVFFAAMDAVDFKRNFDSQEKLFLMERNGEIATGAYLIELESDKINALSDEEIEKINNYYKNEEYGKIIGSYYKILIFKEEAFDSVEIVEAEDINLSKEFIFEILDSDNAMDVFLDEIVESKMDEFKTPLTESQKTELKKNIKEDMELKTDQEIKSMMFLMLFTAAQNKEGPLFLIKQFKQKNVTIYKETALFKALKIIPLKLYGMFT